MNLPTTYQPGFPLNKVITAIWVAKEGSFEATTSHHAALFTELIFNYGGLFQVEGENTESFVSKYNHHIISGLKTSPFQTTISGRHRNVGFIMKPHCYGALLDQFASSDMQTLSEILFEELVEPEQPRFEKIETLLSKFFGLVDIDTDLVKFENYISPEIMRSGALREFSKTTAVSQRSFIEKFKKLYLLAPGEYIKLKQVNYAARLIQKYPKVSLTQIGLESGFYDQSHFIRVFKKHHGYTPKQFQKKGSFYS